MGESISFHSTYFIVTSNGLLLNYHHFIFFFFQKQKKKNDYLTLNGFVIIFVGFCACKDVYLVSHLYTIVVNENKNRNYPLLPQRLQANLPVRIFIFLYQVSL